MTRTAGNNLDPKKYLCLLLLLGCIVAGGCLRGPEHQQADELVAYILQDNEVLVQRYLKNNRYDLDANTYTGQTPLAAAIEAESFDVVPVLLDHGADPLALSGSRIGTVLGRDLSPLSIAVRYSYVDVVRMFMEHSASQNYDK